MYFFPSVNMLLTDIDILKKIGYAFAMIDAQQGVSFMAEQNEQSQEASISVEEAATELGLSRTNLYHYLSQMAIPTMTIGRKAYILRSDLERIRSARGAASKRIASQDVLAFLAGLGLAVTPHSDPGQGWGYIWFGGNWDGPYPTPIDAIKAAFELADKKAQRLADMPFPTYAGQLYWWDGEEWSGARHKDGELQIRTHNYAENDGYEPVQKVIERRDAWLQPAPPTGNDQADEERERARLAALWLTSALREMQYKVDPIDWQHEKLQAQVTVNEYPIGELLQVYNRFREDDFLPWLKGTLKKKIQHVGPTHTKQE